MNRYNKVNNKLRVMTVKVVIIRFEGPYAVCKKRDGSMMDIKRIKLPVGAKEGDVLNIDADKVSIEKEDWSYNNNAKNKKSPVLGGYFDDLWALLSNRVFFLRIGVFFSRISSDSQRHSSITSDVINSNFLFNFSPSFNTFTIYSWCVYVN